MHYIEESLVLQYNCSSTRVSSEIDVGCDDSMLRGVSLDIGACINVMIISAMRYKGIKIKRFPSITLKMVKKNSNLKVKYPCVHQCLRNLYGCRFLCMVRRIWLIPNDFRSTMTYKSTRAELLGRRVYENR